MATLLIVYNFQSEKLTYTSKNIKEMHFIERQCSLIILSKHFIFLLSHLLIVSILFTEPFCSKCRFLKHCVNCRVEGPPLAPGHRRTQRRSSNTQTRDSSASYKLCLYSCLLELQTKCKRYSKISREDFIVPISRLHTYRGVNVHLA